MQIVKEKGGVGIADDKTFDAIEDRTVMEYKAPKQDIDPDTETILKDGPEYDEYRVNFDRDGTPADADEISEMIKQEIINEASDVPKKKIKRAGGGVIHVRRVMKNFKIIELMELFDEGDNSASEMQRPQQALDREMFQDANKRLNFYKAGLVEKGPNKGKYSVKFPTNTALDEKYKGTKYGTKTELENLIKERAEVAKESYRSGVARSAQKNKQALINNLKSAISQADKTKNYNLLKLARRDTGGILSDRTAQFLNQADPSSEFYKGKEFANKFAKDLSITTKKLNFLLNERTASIRETKK